VSARYRLRISGPAVKALAEVLPEKVAAAPSPDPTLDPAVRRVDSLRPEHGAHRRDPWLSTAAYALLIGPLVQIFLLRLALAGPKI
jgi:hypothetical protein